MGWQGSRKNCSNLTKGFSRVNRVSFLGYPVDNVTIQEVLSWIKNSINHIETKTIAVINANKLWQAHQKKKLSDFIKNADLVIPEYAVVWGAKQLGISLVHTGGVMLLKAFFSFAERGGIKPYFLGATQEVVQKMVIKIQNEYPNLKISGFHHGYLTDESLKKAVIEDLSFKKPNILFIAMGSPKQEYLMTEIRDTLQIPVLMGVGGSFDVLSGNKKDAPSWARSKGLEWVYRISQDPFNRTYWQRYLITNTWFVWQVYKQKYFFKKDLTS